MGSGTIKDDYEIHLLMDPEKALDENHELTKDVIDAFGAGEKKVKTYGKQRAMPFSYMFEQHSESLCVRIDVSEA